MVMDWKEKQRLRVEYARQVLLPSLKFQMSIEGSRSKGSRELCSSLERCIENIGQPEDVLPEPFGDVYLWNGTYHIGEPALWPDGKGYHSKKLSGELSGKRGKALTFLLLNVEDHISFARIRDVTGLSEPHSEMDVLMKQMDSSRYFSLKKMQHTYMLETIG